MGEGEGGGGRLVVKGGLNRRGGGAIAQCECSAMMTAARRFQVSRQSCTASPRVWGAGARRHGAVPFLGLPSRVPPKPPLPCLNRCWGLVCPRAHALRRMAPVPRTPPPAPGSYCACAPSPCPVFAAVRSRSFWLKTSSWQPRSASASGRLQQPPSATAIRRVVAPRCVPLPRQPQGAKTKLQT